MSAANNRATTLHQARAYVRLMELCAELRKQGTPAADIAEILLTAGTSYALDAGWKRSTAYRHFSESWADMAEMQVLPGRSG